MISLGRAHAVELRDRVFHGRLEHLHQLRHHRGIALDRPLANRQRLRQAQQIARRQRALHDAAAPRGLERGRERDRQRLVELHFDAGGVAVLHVDGELHPPAADPALDARANPAFGLGQRLRHAQLQVEMAMIDGADRHGDGRVLPFSASPTQTPSCF